MKNLASILFVMVLASTSLGADDRFGMATGDIHADQAHFGVIAGYNDIASVGAGWIRWNLGWVDIEPTKGTYSLNAEKLNQLKLGKQAGLKTCLIVLAVRG